MKVILFSALFSILSCPFASVLAYAGDPIKEAVPAEFRERTVLITSAQSGICATAFWQTGRLYTNAHVAQQMCPPGNCGSIKLVTTAGGKREEREMTGARVSALVRTLDLAEFEVDVPAPPFSSLQIAPRPLPTGETWYAIGYPRCGDLRVTSGALTERTPLSFRTNILGNYGSSGSLIIDSRQRLVGIASQSNSFVQALKAAVFQSDFPLEVTPFDLFPGRAAPLDRSALGSLAKLVLRYHEEQVQSRTGLSRLFAGLQFISLADRLELDWLSSQDAGDIRPWLLLNHYPGEVLAQDEEFYSAGPELIKLVLAYDLEYLGPRATLTRKLGDLKAEELRNVPAELRGQLLDLIVDSGRHPGLHFMMIKFALYLFLAGLVVVPILFYFAARMTRALWRLQSRFPTPQSPRANV